MALAGRVSASAILALLLLLMLPAGVQAQFIYTTNNGTITIMGCTNATGAVTIPSTIKGLPVTRIGDGAFFWSTSLTSVTIPNSVTSIGDRAFYFCLNLTSVRIGTNVTCIGDGAFCDCNSLASVTIPGSVTSIGDLSFANCWSLASVTIPGSVTSIGDGAFYYCTSLTGVYFQGQAPIVGSDLFYDDNNATVYYLPGTVGWDTSFGHRPTALWVLPNPLILDFGPSFGVQTNRFGFIISWATNLSVVVEASTNLASSIWSAVGTNTLSSGSSYFSDPEWTNSPARFYRIRSP